MANFKYQVIWIRFGVAFLLGVILIAILNSLIVAFFSLSSIAWYWNLMILYFVGIVVLLFYRYIGVFFIRHGKLDIDERILVLGNKKVEIDAIEEIQLRNATFLGKKLVTLWITTREKRYTVWSEDLKESKLDECSLYGVRDLLKQNVNSVIVNDEE